MAHQAAAERPRRQRRCRRPRSQNWTTRPTPAAWWSAKLARYARCTHPAGNPLCGSSLPHYFVTVLSAVDGQVPMASHQIALRANRTVSVGEGPTIAVLTANHFYMFPSENRYRHSSRIMAVKAERVLMHPQWPVLALQGTPHAPNHCCGPGFL